MKRSLPLRNSSLSKSMSYMDREQRNAARQARIASRVETALSAPRSRGVMARVVDCVLAVPKEPEPIRSEAYRRAVSALPCINCGVTGYSQAAHPPATARGRKESDLECFPLCCARTGIEGCHIAFDQCRLVPGPSRREQAAEWARKTQAEIKRLGLWPKGLP